MKELHESGGWDVFFVHSVQGIEKTSFLAFFRESDLKFVHLLAQGTDHSDVKRDLLLLGFDVLCVI